LESLMMSLSKRHSRQFRLALVPSKLLLTKCFHRQEYLDPNLLSRRSLVAKYRPMQSAYRQGFAFERKQEPSSQDQDI
jgi:hypothetical protein